MTIYGVDPETEKHVVVSVKQKKCWI
jgi:hypothetical protein